MFGNREGRGGRGGGFSGGGFGGGGGDDFRAPPVKVGDEFNVVIEAVGAKGDGLAKKDGFVLFVPNVKEGQNVRIRVTKVLRKVGFAEVIGEGGSKDAAPAAAPADEEPEAAEEESEGSSEDSEDFGEDE